VVSKVFKNQMTDVGKVEYIDFAIIITKKMGKITKLKRKLLVIFVSQKEFEPIYGRAFR